MHWLCWISWVVCVYRWLLWLRFVRLWYWLGFGVGQQASAGIVWRETTEPGACQLGHIPPSLVCLGALIQLHPPRAVESSRNCSMVNTPRFQAPQEPQNNSVESPISNPPNLPFEQPFVGWVEFWVFEFVFGVLGLWGLGLSFGFVSLGFGIWVCEFWSFAGLSVFVVGLWVCELWTLDVYVFVVWSFCVFAVHVIDGLRQ